jgi:signal peptidase II
MDDTRTTSGNERPRPPAIAPPEQAASPTPGWDAAVEDPTHGAFPLLGGLEIWITLAVVLLDQVSKAIVRARVPLHDDVVLIRGMLDITYVRNSGAAFGLLNTIDFPFKAAVIAIVAAAALVAIAAYAARVAPAQKMARIGLALIVGGAVGNLIDRMVLGYVVDFVDVYWRSYHFWAFNVADSAITTGVAVMVLDMLGLGSHASKTV